MTWRHPNQRDHTDLPRELWRAPVPPPVRAWIERAVGARVRRITRLPGASTTAVHRLDLDDGRRLVVRRYAWPGRLDDEPAAPGREVDALAFAAGHGLAVPEVLAADVSGDQVGDGVPVVVMTFLRGRAVAFPNVLCLAEVAAAIHAVDPGMFGHDYFPWCEGDLLGPPRGARRPELWEQALVLRATAVPPYRATFVHRDFHPGNVLWSRSRCTGVVDWADACRGPAGCDVAHCRANLIDLAGVDAAHRFVAAYESLTGEAHHPYWDLASALEHGPSHWTPDNVLAAEIRLEQALAAFSP